MAPYRFVLCPAPPVNETWPRTRISPYQFKPPLISRSPSTMRMPEPLAAEVNFTLPGMYSVTEVKLPGVGSIGRLLGYVPNVWLLCVPQFRYEGGIAVKFWVPVQLDAKLGIWAPGL